MGSLRAGVGAGQRVVQVPTILGMRSLDTGAFPALDLGVRLAVVLAPPLSLGLHVRYQTSLGLEAAEQPKAGVGKRTSLRVHQLQLGLAPSFRMGASRDATTLAAVLGWGIRGLRPVTELSLPAYTLHGPLALVELDVPIAGPLRARLSPALQWIASTDRALREVSRALPGGWAVGAELALTLRQGALLSIELAYRESHAWVATFAGSRIDDVERFGSLGVLLHY